MTEQIGLHINMTANMSVVTAQMQALTAGVMETTAAYRMLDRSMDNIKFQDANRQFSNLLTSSGQFNARMVTLQTSTEGYGKALEAGRVSGRKLWAESLGYVRKQSGEIRALAREQVAFSRSQMMMTGRLASGAATATVFTPAGIGKDQVSQMQLANKEWEIFNRNAQLGSTAMVNWGKNTQWAGRQLMVGFTIPLMIMGGMAAKTFKELDQELVRLQKVYGSGLTFGEDFKKQSEMIREEGKRMASELAAAYGQAGTETVALMADLAAAGYEGENLTKLTTATTKLSLLGEIDKQEAMKATISLQTAFGLSTDQVAEKVLFLNAVENQTSTSLQDLVEAIPRAGTVIEGLGGSVEDLALYMTAFREGGVSAAEGANALKSGLSSIIAPPKAAVEFMKEFGINLPKMVETNAGDLTGTLMAFQTELQKLDDLAQQQVITKLFGKYQFARMNAFFNNLGAKGSQTQKVLELMGYTTEELGQIANQELESITESVSGKFNRAWQSFKVNLAEVGEVFLKVGTVALDVFNKVFGFFQGKDILRNIVLGLAGVAAVIGPIIMSMGLFGNMLGMMIKGILRLTNGFKVLASGGGIKRSFELLTAESMASNASIDALTNNMFDQQKADKVLADANLWLAETYQAIADSAGRAATAVGTAADRMYGMQTGIMPVPGDQRGITSMPGYARAHDLPRNPGPEHAAFMMHQLKQVGYIPDKMDIDEFIKSSERLNLGGYGYSVQSFATNDLAKNSPQYFTGTIAGEEALGQRERAAAIDPRRFFQQKSSVLLAYGADAKRVADWVEQSTAEVTAAQTKQLTALEAAELHTKVFTQGLLTLADAFDVTDAAARERAGAQIRSKLGVRNPFLETPTSKWATDARDRLVFQAFRDSGGSFAQMDMLDASVAPGTAEMAAAEQKAMKALIEAKTGAAAVIEKSSKLYSDSAQQFSAADEKGLNKAMAAAKKEFGDTAVSFEALQIGTKKFLVALDAQGQMLKTAKGTPVAYSISGEKATRVANTSTTQIASIEKEFATADAKLRAQQLASEQEVTRMTQVRAQVEKDINAKTINIMNQQMTYEMKVAALRRQGLMSEEGELLVNMKSLSLEEQQTVEEFKRVAGQKQETALAQQRLRAAAAQTAIETVGGGGIGGRISGFVSSKGGKWGAAKSVLSSTGGKLGMAGMMSMFLPDEIAGKDISPLKNIGMGAMVGSMAGPYGALAGIAIMTGKEIFDALNKASDDAAKEAAAKWEEEFGNIDLASEALKELGSNLRQIKLEVVMYSPTGDEVSGKNYTKIVEEQMKAEVEKMKTAVDPAAMAKEIYLNLIASGVNAANARAVMLEVIKQSGQTDPTVYSSLAGLNPSQTQAATMVWQESNIKTTQAQGEAFATTEILDKAGQPRLQFTVQDAAEMGTRLGEVYADNFDAAIQAQKIEGPKDVLEYYQTNVDEILGNIGSRISTLDFQDAIGIGTLFDKGGFAESEIGKLMQDIGITWEDIMERPALAFEKLNNATTEQKALLKDLIPEGSNLYKAFVMGQGAVGGIVERIKALDPEMGALITAMQATGAEAWAIAAAIAQWQRGIRQAKSESSFIQTGLKYADETAAPEKVNIDKLRRQEDARIEGMQDAAEAQEEAMQDEIDAVSERYDKEIEKIQQAEDRRQRAFEKEQERFARRQEMRNMELSYQEAMAEGNLFEAARIRMDINATRKQNDAESKREKQSNRAEAKVRALEKERDKKVSLMEDALEKEQAANEAAIEAAQKAADAKVRAAEKANKNIADDTQNTTEQLKAMYDALANHNMKKFNKIAADLGIDAKEKSQMITDWMGENFGKLPETLLDNLAKALSTGNWGVLKEMVDAAINGASKEDMEKLYAKATLADKGIVGMGAAGAMAALDYAEGGFVSGPGTSKSDSIPARLSNGEYVINADSVRKYGKGLLDQINNKSTEGAFTHAQKFAEGGLVGGTVSGLVKASGSSISDIMLAALRSSTNAGAFKGPKKGISAGDIVKWDGEPIDMLTNAQLRIASRMLGSRYSVFQGSYQPETSYSGTTHTDGGVVDVGPATGVNDRSVVELQRAGFAAWYRGPGAPGSAANYSPHIHAISLFSKNLDQAAAYQRGHYLNMSGDGLGNAYYGPHAVPVGGLRASLPGLRSGGKINYDNTLANLHRGETVLTAPLTNKLEQAVAGAGNAEYNINVTINNPSDEIDIERALLNVMSKNERRMGRNRVIR